jgi:hypothetical protein
MKKYFLRTRLAIKLVILVPFFIIICLNFQLSTHLSNNKVIDKNKANILNLENKNSNHDNLKPDMIILNESNDNDTLKELKKIVADRNNYPQIRNRHLIDKLLEKEIEESSMSESSIASESKTATVYKAPNFLIILVQVHSRLNYLKELIESLRQTKYIEETLVVFSHDVYDVEMNKVIESIDFCAVSYIQIILSIVSYFLFI